MKYILLAILLLPACATKAPKAIQKTPVVVSELKLKSGEKHRDYKEVLLKNGMKLIYIPEKTLPRVSLHLLLKVGSTQDPDNLVGVNSFIANLLDQGTKSRTSTAIAEELGQYAISWDASAGNDFSYFTSSSLSQYQDIQLSNFIDFLQNPAFADSEIERMRSQIIAAMIKRSDHPDAMASVLFEKYLFESHPYALPVSGTLESIKKIKRADIIRHYFKYYNPANMTLAVVGNYSEKLMFDVEEKFGSWLVRKAETNLKIGGEEANARGLSLRFVHKEGLDQTQIYLGHLGIERKNPDYLSLKVANFVLGGGFTSRLNQKIRDELGLTYSISSSFEPRKERGPFSISTSTKAEKMGLALKEILKELEEFRLKGISEKELESSKTLITSQFPMSIETSDQLAYNLLVLRFYELSDKNLNEFIHDINALSLKQVNLAIEKHFQPQNLKILMYGDQKKIKNQLSEYQNIEFQKLIDYRRVFVK